ncbi:MAG: hypothetical protein JSV31_30375 [Desulfobacterales bacterium]|nr:MAG: hypothetical protein JSV31_30375 [Desulfobacterales bacterium]
MKTKQLFKLISALVVVSLVTAASAQGGKRIQQSEKEFERLMPITGTVETFFGKFEVDHSFPTKKTSERIYDLMDYSRVAPERLALHPRGRVGRCNEEHPSHEVLRRHLQAADDYQSEGLLGVHQITMSWLLQPWQFGRFFIGVESICIVNHVIFRGKGPVFLSSPL